MHRFILAAVILAVPLAAMAEDDLKTFFPGPQEVAGWIMSYDIQTYQGQKIYDFIDGAGEIFMKYNFEVAAAAEYKGPGDAAISVEVYRMKTPEDAYGVYAYYRPAKYDKLDVPQAGYASGITAGVWRNLYYVKVYGLEEMPGVADAVKEFATAVSRKIPGEGNLPLYFRVLDVDGLVKGSERFARSNLALKNLHFVANDDVLKLDAGAVIIFADYKTKTAGFQAFAIFYPSTSAAQDAGRALARHLGATKDSEVTWYKQNGKAVVGVWTGLKQGQTYDSEESMVKTISAILEQIKTWQLNK